MDQKTDTPAVKTPWHQNELVRWGAGIALGFLLSWLSSRGITPTPIPVPPPTPSVLVLNVGPSTPSTAPVSTVAGGK